MMHIQYLLSILLLMFSCVSFAVQVDVSKMKSGELKSVNWQGLPVLIYKRDENEITQLKNAKKAELNKDLLYSTLQHTAEMHDNEYASALVEGSRSVETKKLRSIRDDILVVLGVSSYFECAINYINEKHDFFDRCSKSEYGLDGRIINPNKREMYHLLVPPHLYNGDVLVIGEDAEKSIKFFDFSPDILSSNAPNEIKLIEALQWGKTDIIPRLLKDPKVINYTTQTGATALHVAAGRSTPDIINSLIKAGFKVNQFTKDGITPLQIALIAPHKEENAIFLIKNKAKIESFCENGVCSKDTKDVLAQYFHLSAEQINKYVSKLEAAANSP